MKPKVPSELLIAECAEHLRADHGIAFMNSLVECMLASLSELDEEPIGDTREEQNIAASLDDAKQFMIRARICLTYVLNRVAKHTETHTDGSKEKRDL